MSEEKWLVRVGPLFIGNREYKRGDAIQKKHLDMLRERARLALIDQRRIVSSESEMGRNLIEQGRS